MEFICYRGPDRLAAALERRGFTRASGPDRWCCWISREAGERFGDAALQISAQKLTAGAGRLGAEHVFVGPSVDAFECVASDPSLVAAVVGVDPDWTALTEDIRLGYRLGRRTPFARVHRLCANESAVAEGHAGRVEELVPESLTADEAIERLVETARTTIEPAAAFELTGGVDSRLVLAVALAAGVKPELAVTLGPEDSEDVLLARALCDAAGMRHERIEIRADASALYEDGRAFARASAFGANVVNYAWLPSVYEHMNTLRSAQVSGVGGECSGSFFDTRLDPYIARLGLDAWWLGQRLSVPGAVGAPTLFTGPTASRVRRETGEDLASAVRGNAAFRRRLDGVYRQQRIRQWASPVLRASSAWYGVRAPLMSDPYVAWALSLSDEHRGRPAQRELIERLGVTIRGVPYTTGRARVSRGARVWKKLKKYAGRLAGAPGRPVMGEVMTAEGLARDGRALAAVGALAERYSDVLSSGFIARIADDPVRWSGEFGALLTTAWAQDEAEEWGQGACDPALPQRRDAV